MGHVIALDHRDIRWKRVSLSRHQAICCPCKTMQTASTTAVAIPSPTLGSRHALASSQAPHATAMKMPINGI